MKTSEGTLTRASARNLRSVRLRRSLADLLAIGALDAVRGGGRRRRGVEASRGRDGHGDRSATAAREEGLGSGEGDDDQQTRDHVLHGVALYSVDMYSEA